MLKRLLIGGTFMVINIGDHPVSVTASALSFLIRRLVVRRFCSATF